MRYMVPIWDIGLLWPDISEVHGHLRFEKYPQEMVVISVFSFLISLVDRHNLKATKQSFMRPWYFASRDDFGEPCFATLSSEPTSEEQKSYKT